MRMEEHNSEEDVRGEAEAELISADSQIAAKSRITKKPKRSKRTCALEAAVGRRSEAGETSSVTRKSTVKVSEMEKVGETNKTKKVGETNRARKIGKTNDREVERINDALVSDPEGYRSRKRDREEESVELGPASDYWDSEETSPDRKRFERFKPETDTESESESEAESEATSSSESEYEAYNPKSGRDKKRWKLPRSLHKYVKKHYTEYAPEEALKEILQEHPRPDHSFLQVEGVDVSIEAGIKEKLEKFAADKVLKADETLRRAQEKVLRVAGPLLNLHKELNKVRKGKRPGKFKLDKVLRLVEKTVILAGQANVGVRYARRLALTNVFTGGRKEAIQLLQKYDKQLQGSSDLFGKRFQAKVEEDRGKDANIGLLSLKSKDKKFRPKEKSQGRGSHHGQETHYQRYESKPFRGGPLRKGGRGGQGAYGGYHKKPGRGSQPAGPRYVTFVISHHQKSRKRSKELLSEPRDSSACGATGVKFKPLRVRKSPTSGPSSVGPRELGETDERPRDPANSQRLQDPICIPTPQGPGNISTEVLGEGEHPHSDRAREIASERSSSSSEQLTGSVSRPLVSKTEEGWVSETHLQLEKVEQVCSLPSFQDGGAPGNQELVEQGRMDGEVRLERRILWRHDERDGQKVDEVPMEKPALRVSVPTLRVGMCSKIVHETDEASCSFLTKTRHEANLLSGRFSDHQFESRECGNRRQDPGNVAGRSGVRNKCGEVCDNPMSGNRISWNVDKFDIHVAEPPRGQIEENSERVFQFVEPGDSVGTTASGVDREAISGYSGNFAGPAVLQAAPVAPDQITDCESILREHDSSHVTSQNRAEVVVRESETVQWSRDHLPRTRQGPGDGRQHDWMGCIVSGPEGPWTLDRVGEERAHQCSGNASSVVSVENVPPRPKGSACTCPNGQHDNGSTHQQIRGHKIKPLDRAHEGTVGVLSESGTNPDSRTLAGRAEYNSRCSVQKETGWERLAVGPERFCSGEQEMEPMLDRFVCQQDKQTTAAVCELEGGPRRSVSGRFPDTLGEGDELHVSPLLPVEQMLDEDQDRESGSGTHCADLASPALVSFVAEAGGESPGSVTDDARVVIIPGGEEPPFDRTRAAQVSGLEAFRERRVAQGFSEEAAALLEKSWRKGTRTAYSSAWRKWAGWCDERSLDPVHAPVVHVVEFFSDMLRAGYEYSTINGFRSAISALHEPIDGQPIGQHPLVKRTLAGVFNEKPPMPKYTDTWDVGIVLAYIKQLGRNSELTDKVLTHKLTMLLALTTANRASEIHGFNLEFMKDEGDSIEFVVHKLTKTRRVGQKPMTVVLTGYPEQPEWDVLDCLRAYFRRSFSWRQGAEQHQLLLGTVPPHKPVVTSTVSGWLKQFMAAAGLDTTKYQGHSVRSATTSRAKAAGLSVKEIMDRANWRNAKTFHRFYDRSVSETTVPFGTVICQ